MKDSSVRDILLAYAIETAAPHEALPSPERCETITQETLHALGQGKTAGKRAQFLGFLAERARRIIQASRLPSDVQEMWKHAPGLSRWLPFAVLVGAFVAGFGLHHFTDPHRVDLIAPSLLGLAFWNLLIYFWILGSGVYALLRRRKALPAPLEPASPPTAAAASAAASPPTGWGARLRKKFPIPGGSGLRRMVLSFERNWWRISRSARNARLFLLLHLGAAMMAVGELASLIGTGFTNAYQVGWESTYLTAPTVHKLLNAIFAPVHWLFGTAPWSLQDIASLQGWATNGPAAPIVSDVPMPPTIGERWVLAYTALLAIVIILPRVALAIWQGARSAWFKRHMELPLAQPYFQKLQRDFGGLAMHLHVLPYSMELNAARQAELRRFVSAHYGAGAELVFETALAYGASLPAAAQVVGGAQPHDAAPVLLINMAATPEHEIHGALLQSARERWGPEATVWLWTRDFAERNTGAPRRLEERSVLWQDFVRQAGLLAAMVPE